MNKEAKSDRMTVASLLLSESFLENLGKEAHKKSMTVDAFLENIFHNLQNAIADVEALKKVIADANKIFREYPDSDFIKKKYHEGRNEMNPTVDNVHYYYEVTDWLKKLGSCLKQEN